MSQVWVPPDISSICSEQQAPLTQCSEIGIMYLALLTRLYGSKKPKKTLQIETGALQINVTGPGLIQIITSPFDSTNSITLHSRLLDKAVRVERKPFIQLDAQSDPFTNSRRKTNEALSPISITLVKTDLGKVLPTISTNQGITIENPKDKDAFYKPLVQKDGRDFRECWLGNCDFGDINKEKRRLGDAAFNSNMNEEKKTMKEGKTKSKRRAETYDFIIVGAGSAGCVVANRLSEVKDWKILLLEAGPEEPEVTSVPGLAPVLALSSVDWFYKTQPEEFSCRSQKGQACPWIKGKMMGGSSALNYMVYMRGNRRDYDEWAELGNHGWSYPEVLPYFKKAENNRDIEANDKLYHSVGGPLNVERFSTIDVNTLMLVQAFEENGLPLTDFNGKDQIGTEIAQSTSFNGRRVSINSAYIQPIRKHRPNLKIITNAFATKILINPRTKNAYGLQYVKDGKTYKVYARKEVIVSSGTGNSPKLLMLSGVGPKHHLESLGIMVVSDLSVGQNLQDHVTTDGLVISLSNKTSTLVSGEELLNSIVQYHEQPFYKTGPLSNSATISAVAFLKTSLATEDAPDIQYQIGGVNVQEFFSDPATYLATNTFPLSFYNGLNSKPLLLVPKSRGYILLNNTDSVFGAPLIYPRYFTDKRDLDVLIAGIRYSLSLEDTPAFKKSGAKFVREPVPPCQVHEWGSDDYFTCILMQYTSTIFHPVGTCKMGPKWDENAVVDPRLRVYGIKRLRVVDASIMPKIIRGNINAPIVMIAEKASDYIKEEWLQC